MREAQFSSALDLYVASALLTYGDHEGEVPEVLV
jgi:hypothetical protein